MPMPNRAKVFPRGYSGGQSDSQPVHQTREGDKAITQLWRQYTSPENHTTAWSFRQKVIQAAVRLLNTRPNWFILQDHNPNISSDNYGFIIDTLRFIATGSRRISIYSWPDLLSNQPDYDENVEQRHAIADVFADYDLSRDICTLIQRWCAHQHGFDDMVWTLNLLFGDLDVKVTS